MKKLLGLLAVAPMSLAACGGSESGPMDFWNDDYTTENDFASKDADKMAEAEKAFGHDEITYIDVRNIADKGVGYIKGFEFVSANEFLRGEPVDSADSTKLWPTGALVDTNAGWDYVHGTTPVNENFPVTQYFGEKDEKLVLFCQSGVRADLIRTVLTEAFGYDEKLVLNAGGWQDEARISDEWKVQVA